MEHIVRYTTASGEDRVEDVGSLDAAIARVEALRNDEGLDNPRLYREVKVEFKTYVRAQIVDDRVATSSVPADDPVPSVVPVAPWDTDDDRPVETADASAETADASAETADERVETVDASAETVETSGDRLTAVASEPPPGAMPLNPQRPTAKVSEALEDEIAPSLEDEGAPRRTLFSRT